MNNPKDALTLISELSILGKPGAFEYAFPVLHHMKSGELGSSKNNRILEDHIKYLENIDSYTDGNNRLICKRLKMLYEKASDYLNSHPNKEKISSIAFARLCHEVNRQAPHLK